MCGSGQRVSEVSRAHFIGEVTSVFVSSRPPSGIIRCLPHCLPPTSVSLCSISISLHARPPTLSNKEQSGHITKVLYILQCVSKSAVNMQQRCCAYYE